MNISNGSIRICRDSSTSLNNSLESHNYPLPLPQDILSTLADGKFFSKLDLSDMHQIEVQEVSKTFLTINTHRGPYRYNRLPFVIKADPGLQAYFKKLWVEC